MKQAFRLLTCSIAVAVLTGAVLSKAVNAQTASPTPDQFVGQITSSLLDSFANDITANGRFVVISSTGDIATEKSAMRNNADGNREIFLFDYAQRRIFQITNTTSARVDPTKPYPGTTPSPSPSPSASPSPSPTPVPLTDQSNIKVEVVNNNPVISSQPVVNAQGQLVYVIAFSSNALTPGNFDGDANSAALAADGNTEIWLYQIPAVADVNLSSGDNLTAQDLTLGTFIQVTNTPASRLPTPGTTTNSAFEADDNRDVAINDDGTIVAFVSTRDIASGAKNNADANPEIFVFNRNTNTILQVTNTQTTKITVPIFNENPSLSGDGSTLAFISNANIPSVGSSAGSNADNNAEIYIATLNGGAVTAVKQVTNTTTDPTTNETRVNVLSPGRRLSRNGKWLGFESLADLTGSGSNQATFALFVYNVTAGTFTQVGPRATSGADVLRFPTFTGDSSTLVFASALNFNPDGTAPSSSTTGLNPNQTVQLFSAPVTSLNSFTRLTNTPTAGAGGTPAIQPFVSNTVRRIAFSLARTELGGGNADASSEAFYLLSPQNPSSSDTSPTIALFTGASQIPVVTPTASPTPTPSPSPFVVSGVAPGEITILQSASNNLAPSSKDATAGASESRRFPLPIELNGVSLEINGAAAGLYSVAPGQINFVVPPGLVPLTGTNTYPLVINNNGALIRSTIQIVGAQPDIFTKPGTGRAMVFIVTNPFVEMAEPAGGFPVTSVNNTGATVPTVLRIVLTGARNIAASAITVTIGTTDLSGTAIVTNSVPRDAPGFDQIDVQIPASLSPSCNVPVIVKITLNGQTFTSRPAGTAPIISIGPCS